MPNKQSSLDRVFKALSDPTRRAVIERLGRGPSHMTELAEKFDMALPSFLQHMHFLEESNLVMSEKRGRVRIYRIAPKNIELAERWIVTQRKIWEKRLDQLDNYLRDLKEKDNASNT